MKSTPTKALVSELNIVLIDLRLEELQRREAIKLLQKNDQFISNKMGKKVNINTFNTFMSPSQTSFNSYVKTSENQY